MEILVEFGQPNHELVDCKLIGSEIRGEFGVAEIFENKGDKLVILDKEKHEMKVIKKIYRGITVKNNRKK